MQEMPVLRVCVVYMYLFVPCLTDSAADDFLFASQLHQEMCAPSGNSVGGSDHNNYSCCGFCTEEQECNLHGSCCLGMYENFTEAKRSIGSTR